MLRTDVAQPNVGNFVTSLRDIGYTFEIAVADILDNSISANARNVKIHATPEPEKIFCLLDDGDGMSRHELFEAMRLASVDPNLERRDNDLGRFGLGLKTASFSQCKKLTVLSKRDDVLSIKRWDLEFISKKNEWLLISLDITEVEGLPLVNELKEQSHGTLVIWQDLDRAMRADFSDAVDTLRKHLSLVFHRFLEKQGRDKLDITINNSKLQAFNPFNITHNATQQISKEKIQLFDESITVEPFILPHHSKLSQQEYEQYATDDGYTKSQGFYLYRADRLLIHGTWWGLHKVSDAHKLVRIRIEVSNKQDSYWGIDIKKATAKPVAILKDDLKRIIGQVVEKGARPYVGRGRKIDDPTTKRFWKIIPSNNEFRFALDNEHPIYKQLHSIIPREALNLLKIYLQSVEAYLPLAAIQSHLHQHPHQVNQEPALDEEGIKLLAEQIKNSSLGKEYIDRLLEAELFKGRGELLGGANE